MKKLLNVLIIAVTVFIAFIIQTAILPSISAGGIKPNIMLIVTASFGFLLGNTEGMLVGLFCGLLCDIFFGPLLGFQMLVYALIGFLCGKFKKLLYVEDLSFPLMMICVSDFIYCFINYVFLFLFRNRLFFGVFFKRTILPEIVYTLIFAVFIYPLLGLIYRKFLREKRAELYSGSTGSQDNDQLHF